MHSIIVSLYNYCKYHKATQLIEILKMAVTTCKEMITIEKLKFGWLLPNVIRYDQVCGQE